MYHICYMLKKPEAEKLKFSELCKWTPRQKDALQALKDGKRFVLYGGALGGGKSFFLRWILLRRLMEIFAKFKLANVPVMLACENYPSLKDRQLQKIGIEFPPYLGTMVHEHRLFGRAFVLRPEYGGGAICFRNLDDPSKYQCFHPDTEILTVDGWKYVSDVTVGESVATMNPESREMTYRPASKTWSYKYNGYLETIFSRGTPSFAVTPNHTIWASTKRVNKLRPYRADELPATAKIPQVPLLWSGLKPADKFQFQSPGNNGRCISFNSLDWFEFLGWYIAEGCTDKSHRFAIHISQINESGRANIINLLNRNGINYHVMPKQISFNNKTLNEYLSLLGLSKQKHIPRDLLACDSEHLWRMLWSLVEADGTWVSDTTGHFVTSSKRLSDDVCELAIKTGFRPTVTLRHDIPGGNPYGDGHDPRYHVHLHRKTNDTMCGQHRKQEQYTGNVYCVTVQPHNTVLTRYNGRVSWSGNSSEFAAIAVDELTKNEYEIFTHLRSRLRYPGLPDKETWFLAGTNPGGPGHGWVKQFWIDKLFPSEWLEPIDFSQDFAFIPSKADDNPHLDAAYWATLQTLPVNLRAAFRDGSWDVFLGQAFPELRRETHSFSWDGVIPENAPLYSTFDWGYGKPFSWLWWYVDSDNRLYCFAEWYGWSGVPDSGMRMPDSDIASMILMKEAELGIAGRDIIRLAGHDSWNKKPDYQGGGQGPSTAEVFGEHGLYLIKADPSRELKIRQFRERIKALNGEAPMMLIADTCEQFWRTVPALVMDSKRIEDLDTSTEDHSYDSAAQICMARPLSLVAPLHYRNPTERLVDNWQKKETKADVEFFGGHAIESEDDGLLRDTVAIRRC